MFEVYGGLSFFALKAPVSRNANARRTAAATLMGSPCARRQDSIGGLWVIGIILYLRATHTRRFAGHLVLWTFIVVFTALWLLSFNGAPPPSVHVLVTVDLILFAIVFSWAYWIDSLRQADETSGADQDPCKHQH